LQEYAQHYSGSLEIVNVRQLIQNYNLPLTEDECMKIVLTEELRLIAQGVELKKGARELLAYLQEHNIRIALATSSFRDRAEGILLRHNILDLFDVFVFGPEVSRGKPFPDVFLTACEKLGEKPEDCLVLEDSEQGIQAAHAAGIPVICIPDMKVPQPVYKEMTLDVVSSLDDVVGYL
ncbi:MAG: HAD family hydrolase, partial [Erysipelotrichaceae bacterium]|nr:HAD family hydrolase [Erysipelotrichaceae bacterium]